VSNPPYVGPLVSTADVSWGDVPAYHTPHREYVVQWRRVLELPGFSWPYTPEDCLGSPEYGTKWLFEDTVQVCTGCGLNTT
jgi:hypothetical protein